MKKLLLLLLCVPLLVFSQNEKRIALVIGNANYDKGELNNPVNDALLIAKTLKQLEFDVILDTNIADKVSFTKKIREFGKKRKEYNHAFVYYAGHGIQIGSENYLLPTKCNDCATKYYNSEEDIVDYAVNVQTIMSYLTGMTNQINVLILDACRDNPYESNWNSTRSLKSGGLAKILAPTGSLIAFSTDAGNTAADGDGKNSIYCNSLAENLLLVDVSLEQVFKKVRTDVLNSTNNQQRPVEESQLTGDDFYLVKSNFEIKYKKIEELLDEKKYYYALDISSEIIGKSYSVRALKVRGDIYCYLDQYDRALEDYNKVIEMDPEYIDVYNNRGYIYEKLEQYDKALKEYDKIINLNSEDEDLYFKRGDIYEKLEQYDKALEEYTKVIEINPEDKFSYFNRGVVYINLKQYDKALEDYDKVIEMDPEYINAYYSRGYIYEILEQYGKALEEYDKIINLNSEDEDLYFKRGNIYEILEQYNKALKEYSKIIEVYPEQIEAYNKRGFIYEKLEKYNKALEEYAKIIEINPQYIDAYNKRGVIFGKLNQYDKALEEYKKVININPIKIQENNKPLQCIKKNKSNPIR